MPENTPPVIVLMGSAILQARQPVVPIDTLQTEAFQQQLLGLKQAQEAAGGIGIAAPQVGWPARVMLLGLTEAAKTRYPQAPDIPFEVWINPEIQAFSVETCWAWEGCLSVPDLRGWIERPSTITVKGVNEKGETVKKAVEGFQSRVFQHEMDHLEGVLFTERAQDVRHLLPNVVMQDQASWPDGWPTPGARVTAPGALSVIP